jgi:hypothetical protein
METWSKYTTECMNREGSQKFDATRFKQLIDGFAPQLVSHLAEEIPTLLALDKYDIAAVKKAFQRWDKHVQSEADVVSICSSVYDEWALTKYSGVFIPWAWGMSIGLMREGTIFQKYHSSYRTSCTTCLGGSIGLCGDSIQIPCLGKRGHWYSCRKILKSRKFQHVWILV